MLARQPLLKPPGKASSVSSEKDRYDSRKTKATSPISNSSTNAPSNSGIRRATFAPIKNEKTPPIRGPSIAGIMMARRLSKRLSTRIIERRKEREALQTVAPTYRMEPMNKFDNKKVENAIKDVVETRLKTMTYSARIAAMVSRVMSEEIKDKVKGFKFDRYKIVCLVTMGEKKEQNLMIASRCSWDPSVDSCSTYTFENGQMFCTATVYGLYNE